MSYLKLNHHTIDCNNLFKYIEKSQEENKQFWLHSGLSEEQINNLINMESDEKSYSSPLGYYASRKYLLIYGKICIDDIKKDIEEYKMRG